MWILDISVCYSIEQISKSTHLTTSEIVNGVKISVRKNTGLYSNSLTEFYQSALPWQPAFSICVIYFFFTEN